MILSPRQPPRRTPTEVDIAWAAGIYEGEGCTVFTGTGVATSVTQRDTWLLYRLQELFGGSIAQYRGYGTWRVCGDSMRAFITAIEPFLSPRRRSQINAARSAIELHR